jgi:hypothetical protein
MNLEPRLVFCLYLKWRVYDLLNFYSENRFNAADYRLYLDYEYVVSGPKCVLEVAKDDFTLSNGQSAHYDSVRPYSESRDSSMTF